MADRHGPRTIGRCELFMRTKQFVLGLVTPTIVILALLVFAVVQFRDTLALAQQRDKLFRGYAAYNAGLLEMDFQRDGGKHRPLIRYDGRDVLQYEEWSSAVVVDGQVYGLWDHIHGYNFDDGARKVFSTITGSGWQVIQVITVRDSSVEVAYTFDANTGDGMGTTTPHHVTLIVNHQHDYWVDPTISQQTFQGGVVPELQNRLPAELVGVPLHASWIVSLRAHPADGVQSAMRLGGPDSETASPAAPNTAQTWVNQFTTTYSLDNPPMNVLTPIGVETITVRPEAGA